MIEEQEHSHCRKCGSKLSTKAKRKKGFCDKCVVAPLPGQLMFTFDEPKKKRKHKSKAKVKQ